MAQNERDHPMTCRRPLGRTPQSSLQLRLKSVGAILFSLATLATGGNASAGDSAQLISVSIPAGAQVTARSPFIETWTFRNTGTTTWTPGRSGYTLNALSPDSLAAVPLSPTSASTPHPPSATIDSGQSVGPGAQATFSMSFIAPATAGSFTNTYQLNSANSV